jgi:hydrogenase expression/formation protein HypC
MAGVIRVINMGLLDEPLAPGDWVLVHMGFALQPMTAAEAQDALDALGAERKAEDAEAADLEALVETAVREAEAAREAAAARESAAGTR